MRQTKLLCIPNNLGIINLNLNFPYRNSKCELYNKIKNIQQYMIDII